MIFFNIKLSDSNQAFFFLKSLGFYVYLESCILTLQI